MEVRVISYKVYRTVTFEKIITEEESYIKKEIKIESEKLSKLPLSSLVKSKVYEVTEDQTDWEEIDTWSDDCQDDEER